MIAKHMIIESRETSESASSDLSSPQMLMIMVIGIRKSKVVPEKTF